VKTLQPQQESPPPHVLKEQSLPVKTWDLYILQEEWLKNRSDIEGYNTNTFDSAVRRVSMTCINIYEDKTDKKVGEMAYSHKNIEGENSLFNYYIENNMYNIFDELIVPNNSTGYITKRNGENNANPYKNLDYYFPVKQITQDIFGRKVVIIKRPDNKDEFGKLNWRLELYKEEY
jgi:hypothetical protein